MPRPVNIDHFRQPTVPRLAPPALSQSMHTIAEHLAALHAHGDRLEPEIVMIRWRTLLLVWLSIVHFTVSAAILWRLLS